MAFVVARPGGSWEIRESRSTPNGPRSRTLASFRRLTSAVVEQALARAERPTSAAEIERAARRAGAPVALPPADEAAVRLLDELAHGKRPAPALRRALAAALAEPGELSPTEEGAAEWAGASPERRGRALWDLLLLADAVKTAR